MPTILSIADIIEIGRASTYLSANYTSKKSLFGGSVIKPTPPVQIAWVTDALDWGNSGGAQTAASLRSTANYALWLYGLFQLQAQGIIFGPGGGSVVPTPSGGGSPNDLDFEVTASSIMVTGATSLSIPQFIGYNVDFARGGITQNTTNLGDGSSYYAWNNVTGIFTIFPAASEGELFRIMVDAGGGNSTVVPTQSFPIVITSADFESDGVTYLNSNIANVASNNVYLLANNTPNPVLFATTDFIYVAGGIQIILAGFDANTFNYTIAINQIN